MTDTTCEHEASDDLRTTLLRACRAAGATAIVASYDGYGDSGNVEDVAFEPSGTVAAGETAERLDDFLWSMAYAQHPGFENNEGGYGTVRWNLADDTISLDHSERYIEIERTVSEGL